MALLLPWLSTEGIFIGSILRVVTWFVSKKSHPLYLPISLSLVESRVNKKLKEQNFLLEIAFHNLLNNGVYSGKVW